MITHKIIEDLLFTNNKTNLEDWPGRAAYLMAESQTFYLDEFPDQLSTELPAKYFVLPFPKTTLIVQVTERERAVLLLIQEKPQDDIIVMPIMQTNNLPNIRRMTPHLKYIMANHYFAICNIKSTDKYNLQTASYLGSLMNEISSQIDTIKGRGAISSAIVKSFLHLLHCSNTTIETIRADRKLNEKRKAKGKHPIVDYKILKFKPGLESNGPYIGNKTGETRRLHIRRGHFAHRWKGKGRTKLEKVWIDSCVAGDPTKGVLVKDYKPYI